MKILILKEKGFQQSQARAGSLSRAVADSKQRFEVGAEFFPRSHRWRSDA